MVTFGDYDLIMSPVRKKKLVYKRLVKKKTHSNFMSNIVIKMYLLINHNFDIKSHYAYICTCSSVPAVCVCVSVL